MISTVIRKQAMSLPASSENTTANSSHLKASYRFVDWTTIALICAAAVVLRFFDLSSKPFWSDECFSVEIAWIGWRNFLHLMWWREANMSLYYILLRGWLHFGHGAFFIRSLSVVLAIATLPAIYWVANLLYGRRVALIAGALLAFNAYHVRYSQEARSYTLFVLLATFSSRFLIAWLHEPERRYRIGSAVYAHFYALLLLIAQVLVLCCWGVPDETTSGANSGIKHEIQQSLKRAWTVIAIAVLPIIIFVAKTGAGPIKWIHRPGLRDLYEFWQHFSGGSSWPLALIFALACLAAIFPVRKQLLVRNRPWETWRCQFLLMWLLLPVLLTVVISFARPVFLARYMIFCLPAFLILVSAGLAQIRPSWLLAPALILILLFSLQGISFVYAHDYDNDRDAAGAATDLVLDHAQPGDAIIFYIPATRIPYEFFRSQRAGQNTASPNFTTPLGPEILFPNHSHSHGLDYRDFTGKPTADFLRTAPPTHPRVWVMLMNNQPPWGNDPTTAMLTQTLSGQFRKMEGWQFPKVELRLYSK
jgi:mannosyltransferase